MKMKNLLALLFSGLIVISCGSTKDMEEVEEEAATPELVQPKPQEAGTRATRNSGIDIDKVIAQLGLSEAQEEEFLLMWNTTEEQMKKVRMEYAGQRDLLLPNLRAIKNERFEAIDRILSPEQFQKYRELMSSKRRNAGARRLGDGN